MLYELNDAIIIYASFVLKDYFVFQRLVLWIGKRWR